MCQHRLKRLFQHYSIDILLLQIYYTFTALAIVVSNGVLLHKLFKKRHKTRADKMFIILSCSDIGVGLVSVPMLSLPLFIKDLHALCQFSSMIKFFVYTPYGFSWFMVIIIALDRVLVVTKGYIYKKYVTMKHLYCLTVFSLLLHLTVTIKVTIKGEFMKRNSFVMRCIQISFELCFIIITIVAYMYLFYFVRSKSRQITTTRHGGIDFDRNLMMTITYTYVCLLLFTFPYFARRTLMFFFPVMNPKIERNVQYWGGILVFSNSYANAIIILYKIRRKQKDDQHIKLMYQEKTQNKNWIIITIIIIMMMMMMMIIIIIITTITISFKEGLSSL